MAIAPIMKTKHRISQDFGKKLILNGKDFYASFGLKGHNGVDFAMPIGVDLLAGLEGEITVKDYGRVGYGLAVSISRQRTDGSSGIIYAHLSSTKLKTGDKVKVGDIIGKSGNTGASTGPHLHFGLRMRNKKGEVIEYNNGFMGWIDPMQYFNGAKYWVE